MNLEKTERKSIALLLGIAVLASVLAVSLYFAEATHQKVIEQNDATALKAARKEYPMNEVIAFNAKDDGAALPSGKTCMTYSNDWNGELELGVFSAQILTTEEIDEQYIDEKAYRFWRDEALSDRFLVCDISLKNISAQTLELDNRGNETFNIGFLLLSETGNPPLLFQDSNNKEQKDYYRFSLPIGEKRDFTVIYDLPAEYSQDDMYLQVGGMYKQGLYFIKLNIE